MSASPSRFAVLPRSIERRLPFTIAALIASIVIVFSAASFQDARVTARLAAQQRLESLSDVVLRHVSQQMERRATLVARAMQGESVTRLLQGETQLAQPVLEQLARGRRDAAFVGFYLFDANRTMLGSLGPALTAHDMSALSGVLSSIGTDSTYVSAIYDAGEQHRLWSVSTLWQDGQVAGYIAESRWIRANANAEERLEELTGVDLTVHFASAKGGDWYTYAGDHVQPLFDIASYDGVFSVDVNDSATLVRAFRLPQSDVVVLMSLPEGELNARAISVLRRTMPFALALLVLGSLAGWVISRRVTRPLRALSEASDAIARGDFSRRVPHSDDSELQQLATAFNSMAERVGESLHALEVRNDELRLAQQEANIARVESERAAREAERANEAKTTFLAVMSHELRTPLSAIGGYTEILQLGLRGELNEAQQADLERIRTNQQHLLTIINDMLDLSQVESGQLSVHCEDVLLDQVLTQVEPIVAPLIARKRLSYEVDPNVRLLSVHADRERLRQVFVNLIANASRFSDAGGIISVHGSQKNGRVFIHVTDTGIGIPQEKLEAIFEPFIQVETGPTRRSGGTGLGLPISRKLAVAMDGSLSVHSELGVGSTFTLELRAASVSTQMHRTRVYAEAVEHRPLIRVI